MKVATSIIIGIHATSDLAGEAVADAMQKADISIASSVLLLLTSEFAGKPQAAIKDAAKAANCTQVMGCSATGIFTEDDWVLDAPAAAAMVFGDDITLALPNNNPGQQPLLTITAPNAINSSWLNNGSKRYGGVSGDAIGQGPFSVWQNAKGDVSGHVEAFFSGVKIASGVSHGLHILTQPQQIQQTNNFDLIQLNDRAPLSSLTKAWQSHSKNDGPAPLHLVIAIYADSAEYIRQGKFDQATIISCDEVDGSITMARPLKPGQFLSWCLRDTAVAEADFSVMSQQLATELNNPPDFGLLFSCLGRGPYFYNGIDRDLKVITQMFPHMPLLGFYGNGEIAHINGSNQLLPYSAVLNLFAATTTTTIDIDHELI
jgi:small ligand-binding sensory domain FIST